MVVTGITNPANQLTHSVAIYEDMTMARQREELLIEA